MCHFWACQLFCNLAFLATFSKSWTIFFWFQRIREFIETSIQEHLDTFNGEELRDFIDVYISEMAKEKDPDSSFFGENGRENLVTLLLKLFYFQPKKRPNKLACLSLGRI